MAPCPFQGEVQVEDLTKKGKELADQIPDDKKKEAQDKASEAGQNALDQAKKKFDGGDENEDR
jgi:hypothetical protein